MTQVSSGSGVPLDALSRVLVEAAVRATIGSWSAGRGGCMAAPTLLGASSGLSSMRKSGAEEMITECEVIRYSHGR